MKTSFTHLITLALGLSLFSCSPMYHSISVDVRYPSGSGVNVPGKTVSVICLQSPDTTDSALARNIADGFTQGVEASFFDSKPTLDILTADKRPGADYSNRDSLLAFLMEVNTDIVFLVDVPQRLPGEDSGNSFKAQIYAYDALGAVDTVFVLSSTSSIDPSSETFASDGLYFGYRLSNPLKPAWKAESHYIVYYDDMDDRWMDALEYACDMQWSKAIDIWLKMMDTNSYEKRSCLAYNIALGCYMLDQFDLCEKWMNKSDSEMMLSITPTLRRRMYLRRAGR